MATRPHDIDYTDLIVTRKWFSRRNLEPFRSHVMPRFTGKPCVYLEIGVFEGCSLAFMFQKVLTHPESRAVGIDTWLMTAKRTNEMMDEVMSRAHHNVKPWASQKVTVDGVEYPRCQLIRAMSADALRMMRRRHGYAGIKPGTVDLALIDGHHGDISVLDDARQVIELVRTGGLIIFDDVRGDKPKEEDHVERGMKLFLQESGERVTFAFSGRYLDAYDKIS